MGDVAMQEDKFQVGAYYRVTTGFKREFHVWA